MEGKGYTTIKAAGNAPLKFLYGNAFGRVLLKLIIRPFVTKLGGACLNSRLSSCMIGGFIRKNHIDMADYESGPFRSFNDFFKRRIKAGRRPIPADEGALFAPADAKLSVYRIAEESSFLIKGFRYDVCDILGDEVDAQAYKGGDCLIFRLTPDDYHRYCFIDDGVIETGRFIPGVFHTVQPIALSRYAVFGRNARAVTIVRSARFGRIAQVEVGALFVGRITNSKTSGTVARGEEKGMFEFGGSTIVLLLQKGAAVIDEALYKNTENGLESLVKLGQEIGRAAQRTES